MYEELVKQLQYCATHDCMHEGEKEVGCTAPYDVDRDGITTCNDALMLQAADAIEKLQAYIALYKDGGETAMTVANDYKARLEELQAAKCPHLIRNIHDRGNDSLCHKWLCEVTALPKWIPVTERLPLKGDRVLCVGDNGIQIADYVSGDKWCVLPWFYVDGEQETGVSHWMLLPEPPKEETE